MNKILLLMLIYIKLNSQLYLNYNTSNDFNDENDYIYQGTRLIIYEDISKFSNNYYLHMKDNIKNDTTINISNYIYSNNIKVFIKTHYIHISNIYSTGRFSYKDFKNIRFMKPYNDTLFINNLILKNQLREYTSPDTLK